MRVIVFPDDPMLTAVFGAGLNRDPLKAARTYRARLLRAEGRGTLPARVYVSPRRFGWDKSELETALSQLPRSYSGFKPAARVRHVSAG